MLKKILYISILLLFTSCAVTYDVTPRCELMQRGQPCLTNHACCKPPQTYYQTYPNYNWWYLNKPTTNYVIVKPNKPNKPNNKPRPNRKPKHRK